MPVAGTPDGRSGLRAGALYAYLVGSLVVALSAVLEPRELKDIPHGILLGLLVLRLPLVVLPLASLRPRPRFALFELVLWTVAVLAALPGLHPSLFLMAPLMVLPEGAIGVFALAYGIATLESLGAALRATLRTAAALVAEVRERGAVHAALTMACAALAVGAVAALLAEGAPLAWLDPPITLDTRSVLSIVVLGPVAFLARIWVEARPGAEAFADVGPRDEPARPPVAAILACLLLVEALFVADDQLGPYGIFPSSLVVRTSAARPELARDGVTEELFRTAQRRSGISAGGERFVVEYGERLVAAPFDSLATFTSNGAVLILLNETIPESRRRNLLLYQFTRGLLALRAPTVAPRVALGYAYWAAENTRNPFVVGLRSGVSPQAVCATAETLPSDQPELFRSSLASLPFIQAEARDGAPASQELLLRIAHSDLRGYLSLVAAECEAYVVAHPPPAELAVDPGATGAGAIDEAMVRAALDDAKLRSGMDALGRPLRVVLGPLPQGTFSHSDFTDGTRVVITISPSLPVDQRREHLVFQFTGVFATIRYGDAIEPVRSGLAMWAARWRGDPFVTGASSGRAMCAQATTADLTRSTATAGYLSSIPFVDAESEGGVPAVQELALDRLSRASDLAGWRELIQRGCARRYP